MKILPVGAELFLVEGRTERHDEVNTLFAILGKAPKRQQFNKL
jgi:hypothetical protein